MSAPSFCASAAARRRIIRSHDRMQPLQFQRRDHGEPDRAAADHQRHLVAADIGLGHRVHADRQRLGQRRMFRREAVRHFQQQRLAEQHALGIAADIVVGIADALRPLRRQQRRQRTDAGAGFQLALGAGAVIEHLAAEFVAEHDIAGEVHRLAAGKMPCHFDHAMGMLARVQVGAADAAGQRPDQHLPRGRLRLGHGVDDDLAVPENGCAQSFLPASLFIVMASNSNAKPSASAIRRWETTRRPAPEAASA